VFSRIVINSLKPTGHVMHHQFNIQQMYDLPTQYLCVLYLSKKNDLCHLQHKLIGFFITEMKIVYSAVRTGSLNKAACASSLEGLNMCPFLISSILLYSIPATDINSKTFFWRT
jgi:hypothetical protein